MMVMLICVDIDDVINDLTPKALEIYNSRTGKNIQMNDIVAYDFYECLSKEDADGIVALFKEKELWDSLEPLPGSQKALRQLINQGYHIIIATATDPCNFAWKCEWLSKYFPFIPTDNIIRIMDKSLLRIDVILDDNLDNLTSNVCERICMDYSYNQNPDKDYVYDINRIKSWDEFPGVIKDIERRWKEWETR
jgi:5'(3')-deoxyribonucleotidase